VAAALTGIRVLDLSTVAPGPYCTMLLADLGADVLVVEAPGRAVGPRPSDPLTDEEAARLAAHDALRRNKRSIVLDLKAAEGRRALHQLAEGADVVVEGFRPGVVERLGVDDATLRARNPRLIYCSLSGYGQTGPYAPRAGHDLTYIAYAGALGCIGRPDAPPAIPLNLIGDFAGGGLMAAFAISAALVARGHSGVGQRIDLAMSDGVLSLLTAAASRYFAFGAVPRPGRDRIAGGVPYYEVYRCRDGRHLAVAPLEPRFFAELCRAIGRPELEPLHGNAARWPDLRAALERRFAERTRDEWAAALGGTDACVAPVYDLAEALADPQCAARGMVVEVDGVRQIGVAPKLSATPGTVRTPPVAVGAHTAEVLRGLSHGEGAWR